MYNAAIVVFRRSTLPRILKFFAMPGISQVIEAGGIDCKVRVHVIECPVMSVPADNKKVMRSLLSLFQEHSISLFAARNAEYYWGSGLEQIEKSVERSSIDEVKAIKALAALIKLSGDKGIELLKRNMCFIGCTNSYRFISTMAEEASGVFIYENDKMDSSCKEDIYVRLMAEKGISAVFTKDLRKALSQCDIIIADAGVELESYKSELTGKVLIGDNPAEGDFEKVGQVLLWYESLEGLSEESIIMRFNDELLTILKNFFKGKGVGLVSFLRRYPYIQISKHSLRN